MAGGLLRLGLGAEAAGANLHADGLAGDADDLPMEVGAKGAVGLVGLAFPTAGVAVADVAAEGRAFAADCANGRHRCISVI